MNDSVIARTQSQRKNRLAPSVRCGAETLAGASVYSSHQIPRPVDCIEDEEQQRKDGARDDLHHDGLVARKLFPPGRQPARHSGLPAVDRQRWQQSARRRPRGLHPATAAAAAAVTSRRPFAAHVTPASVGGRLRRCQIDRHQRSRRCRLLCPSIPQQLRLHLQTHTTSRFSIIIIIIIIILPKPF